MNPSAAAEVRDYFGKFPVRHFQPGEIIIWAGYEPEHIYYITSGRVRQYYIFEDGDRVAVNVYRAGAFFSMAWAINRPENRYFFEAMEDTSLRCAPIGGTLEFVRSRPDVMLDLLGRVFRGTDGLLERMVYLMSDDTSKRLVFELVTECKRGRTADNSALITLSESELGLHTGLARETVSRHMRRLKTAGLVDVTTEGIHVTDVTGLEKLLQ